MRFVVVNPQSAGGRTGRSWPRVADSLRQHVGDFQWATTRGHGDATRLVRDAVAAGAREVIAVGGDGTIGEAVNGLLAAAGQASTTVAFGFIGSGTGGDFCRSLGLAPGLEAACRRLAGGSRRVIDVGRLEYADHQGNSVAKTYANMASFGVSGATASAANSARYSRALGPRNMFRFLAVAQLLSYRFQRVGLRVDGREVVEGPIATVAVANGCSFGGGMRIAPDADIADGLLDVVVVKGESRRELISAMHLVYKGAHLSHPAVRAFRGRLVEAVPLDGGHCAPILLETDGEVSGRLPATFEAIPGALTLMG